MYYAHSENGKKLCELFAKYRREIYPDRVKCIPRPSGYAEDAAWFHTHMEDIARADTKALCEWFGKTYVEPDHDEQETSAPRLGLDYSKADGFSWYVDGIETTPRGFMDALTSLMED